VGVDRATGTNRISRDEPLPALTSQAASPRATEYSPAKIDFSEIRRPGDLLRLIRAGQLGTSSSAPGQIGGHRTRGSKAGRRSPGRIRVNDLARELDVRSKSILDASAEVGISRHLTHSSTIEEHEADLFRGLFSALGDEEPLDAASCPTEYVGLTLIDGRFRLVEMCSDGTYRYLDPSSRLHELIYAVSSETVALQQAIEELEDLLNSKAAQELDFQRFFESNPEFITSDDHVEARPDVYLSREGQPMLKPDFMLKPLDPRATSDILELKLPSSQVYVLKSRRERLSQAVMEARAQLMEYSRYFDDTSNREFIQGKYGLFAYHPRLFVLIGRRGNLSPMIRRKAELTASDLHLLTYDDIVERMRHKLERMTRGWRSTAPSDNK